MKSPAHARSLSLHPRKAGRALLLTGLLLILPACEQRVVSHNNQWIAQDYGKLPELRPEKPKPANVPFSGFFNSAGDLLFGWTRAFEEKPNGVPIGATGPTKGYSSPNNTNQGNIR